MWPNTQFSADLVTFTEEIFNGKLRFLCSVPLNSACFPSPKPVVVYNFSEIESTSSAPFWNNVTGGS